MAKYKLEWMYPLVKPLSLATKTAQIAHTFQLCIAFFISPREIIEIVLSSLQFPRLTFYSGLISIEFRILIKIIEADFFLVFFVAIEFFGRQSHHFFKFEMKKMLTVNGRFLNLHISYFFFFIRFNFLSRVCEREKSSRGMNEF